MYSTLYSITAVRAGGERRLKIGRRGDAVRSVRICIFFGLDPNYRWHLSFTDQLLNCYDFRTVCRLYVKTVKDFHELLQVAG